VSQQKSQTIAKHLAKATFNYGLGSVLPKVIGFLLIPLYTLYLTPNDYGIVEICGSLGSFMIIFMRLGVPGAVSRYYLDYGEKDSRLADYVTTVHHFLLLASVTIGVLCSLGLYWFGEYVTPGLLFVPFVLLIMLNGVLSANGDLQKRLIQSREQSRYSAILSVVNSLVGIAAAIVMVVWCRMGALGFIWSQTITSVIFFVQAQWYLRPFLRGRFDFSMLKESLAYGIHILPHHLSAALAPLLCKLVLLNTNSMAALGIFSLAGRFSQPMEVAFAAFNKAYQPVYFKLRKEGAALPSLLKMVNGAWAVFAWLYLGMAFLVPPLVPLLTPERFHPSASLVPFLANGFMWQVSYFLLSTDLYYLKHTRYVPAISFSGLVVTLLSTFLLAPAYGGMGLAIAQIIGFAVWAVLAFYFLNKKSEVQFGFRRFLAQGAFISAALAAAWVCPISAYWLRGVLFLVFLVASLFFLDKKWAQAQMGRLLKKPPRP
jgi:O-antigen/teichoic acid export membrane protein